MAEENKADKELLEFLRSVLSLVTVGEHSNAANMLINKMRRIEGSQEGPKSTKSPT
jgi:hypothetical protein